MKKSLFYWAFLAFVGMSLTACSSDDSITDNEKPVIPNSNNNEVILTGTIGIGSDGTTRAISDAGAKSWTVGDEICVQYETNSGTFAKAKGRITEGGGTQNAKFTATLVNPKNNGNIGFAYPYDKVTANGGNATDFTFNYDAYNNQDGTTSGITSSGLDYAYSESAVQMEVNGTKAELKANAPLENQFCMYKFTIADSKTATLLEIIIANIDNFTTPKKTYYVKPASAANVFYVALEPKETGDKVKVVASIADVSGGTGAMKLDTDYKISLMSSSDIRKFISVDTSDGYQAYLCSSANKTTATVCEHTYGTTTSFVKDKFYSKTLTTNNKTLSPVAVVGYAANSTSPASNYFSKFVAIALEDVPTSGVSSMSDAQSKANTWVGNHKVKIGSTECFTLYGANYDVVKDNANADDTAQPANDNGWESSATRSTAANQGWRIPSVTDFRYIFEGLSNVSATNPKGIVEQYCHYPTSSPQHESVVYTYIYDSDHDTGETKNPRSDINDLCDTELHSQYYWTSSTLYGYESTKGWRYHFGSNLWEFNSITEMSYFRAVLAY